MATAKKMISTVSNDKDFSATLKLITLASDGLAQMIHITGLYAIQYANLHGDVGKANQLIDAMGKKHDKKRVQQWLVKFGKIGVKEGVMVFRKRKDINPENYDAWYKQADALPYWELNAQPQLKMTFNYLTMVNSIIDTHNKKVAELVKNGKTVSEVNVAIIDSLKAMVKGYTPEVDVK